MKRIKLVVFDMAGTAVDEDNVVYKTLQKMLAEQGFDIPLSTVLEYGSGKEKLQAMVDVLSTHGEDINARSIAERAFHNFKPALISTYETMEVKPIEGVDALLPELHRRGVKIVLNTGYDRKIAEMLLNKLDWQIGRDIDGLVAADDVENGRPAPDSILAAMALCGVGDPDQVLKAGDSAIDIEEGKNAQCGVTVGVLSGAQTREQLEVANPSYILNSLKDLDELDIF